MLDQKILIVVRIVQGIMILKIAQINAFLVPVVGLLKRMNVSLIVRWVFIVPRLAYVQYVKLVFSVMKSMFPVVLLVNQVPFKMSMAKFRVRVVCLESMRFRLVQMNVMIVHPGL